MKKGYELLGKLSKDDQVNFCRNIINHRPVNMKMKISEYLIKDYTSFELFIGGAFTWGKTPEGGDYWSDIAQGL